MQLLDYLKEKRQHWNLKENALERIAGGGLASVKAMDLPQEMNIMYKLYNEQFLFQETNNFCCERNGMSPHLRNELRCMLLFVPSLLHIRTTYQLPYRPTYITLFPLQQAQHSSDFPQHTLTATSQLSIFATLSIVSLSLHRAF
jgi:hypothetical protein